jgi:hypothetical protein
MASPPTTVAALLERLPEDRRRTVEAIRAAINRRLPKGYREGVQGGMIGWSVPHGVYAPGYHCDPRQPVPFACLGVQKHHVGLYLMGIYMDDARRRWFEAAWTATGRRLDAGKACIRVRTLEDVPLDIVEEAVARMPVARFLAKYEANLPADTRRKRGAGAAPPVPKAPRGAGAAMRPQAKKPATARGPAKRPARPAAKGAARPAPRAAAKAEAKAPTSARVGQARRPKG